MPSENKKYRIVFTGGGTGGHIYPGIAVADALRKEACDKNISLEIYWIGSNTGMDRTIIEKNLVKDGGSIDGFYGIPCGKLRRYFSWQNFTDLFRIIRGYFSAKRILRKLNPDCVFSKGGFVSVPPCRASAKLHIPYYTHECDFTPGLATRLNSGKAGKVFVSYEETKKYFAQEIAQRCVVTGNPVRPVFYEDTAAKGLEFLGIPQNHEKPVLLVLGGSLGARQVNSLVVDNLQWLKERFIVVQQTGKAFAEENPEIMKSGDDSYKPFAFIYSEMPSVVRAADVILSRSGANSLWECAVASKPMVLVPLCGSGTRGDQVDNARYFEKQNAAYVLAGEDATADKMKASLESLLDENKRKEFSSNCEKITAGVKTAEKIAKIILEDLK